MILITGGAGFIGSNLVASLNADGVDDIAILDDFSTGTWKNLAKRRFRILLPCSLQQFLLVQETSDPDHRITAVVHLAAITDTQQTVPNLMLDANYTASVGLLRLCQSHSIPLIYASSAAVYGDGSQGFSESALNLRPLNLYGWSKLLFDRHVMRQDASTRVTGLRFFNVYGPNEYHKGKMASLLSQYYGTGQVSPYYYIGGEIRRDFVYVEDVVDVIRWFLRNPTPPSIFNVGTGTARRFTEMLSIPDDGAIKLARLQMPPEMLEAYQAYTRADLTLLRQSGCNVTFRQIEQGIPYFVDKYLSQRDRYR